MVNEFTQVKSIVKDLKSIIERENKRHQMDQHLTISMRMLLEDEIIPMLENELARAVIFEDQGNFVRANDCLRLKRLYERRAMEECISEPPMVAKDSDPGPT